MAPIPDEIDANHDHVEGKDDRQNPKGPLAPSSDSLFHRGLPPRMTHKRCTPMPSCKPSNAIPILSPTSMLPGMGRNLS